MEIIKNINTNIKARTIMVLLMMSFSCCFLLLIRIYITHQFFYLFLAGNLFLALIPLMISYYLYNYQQRNPARYFLIISMFLLWVLFLPNASYIITDFIHLHPRSDIPLWFDAMLIFSFATTGFMAGLISLYFVHEMLNKILSKNLSWILIVFIIGLSGYGIYLGRFLRWHSKDLFFNTKPLLLDVIFHLKDTTAIAMTGMFSFLILFSYFILHCLIDIKKDTAIEKIGSFLSPESNQL
jgi:uncharacterized membrane protein